MGIAGAQAVPVNINFSGNVSAVTDPNFSTLLAVGDAVSGSIQREFNPPDAFQVLCGVGSYTVPASAGSGMSIFDISADTSFPAWDFRKRASGGYAERH